MLSEAAHVLAEAPPLCGKREASCACGLAEGHDGPHVCRDSKCRGSWHHDELDAFVVDALPLPFRDSTAARQ